MQFAPPARADPAAMLEAEAAADLAGHTPGLAGSSEDALRLCRHMRQHLPPMEGTVKYKRSWSIEESLEQHQCLMRQHELQSTIGQSHVQARKMYAELTQITSQGALARAREALSDVTNGTLPASSVTAVATAARNLKQALKMHEIEALRASGKQKKMEDEIEKNNQEMIVLREAIDDIAAGGGPDIVGMHAQGPTKPASERQYFYCSDCHVGGHGNRFCRYLLQRPNWRIYPSEKWFEDKNGQVSYCPLGKRGVDFTDETYFSRISMHLKGRIWLEDKRKLYEFSPDLMPLTYVIVNQQWVGTPPPAETPGEPPMPWFVKETDRNWGTSVVCCAKSSECMGLAKPNAVYVVQKHIPRPLLYTNGEKCHIKFYNLLVGMADGVTWKLWTYKDGYLSISPKPWSATDLSKETQVTIIRTKRINDWEHWEEVYPKCKAGVAEVMKRAAQQGKLEGRNKVQFEIFSADYIVTEDKDVYLLEFNMGPVLKDAEDSPDVHDAGMVNGAMHIVEPWEGGDEDKWDFALEVKGHPPPRSDDILDAP